MAFRFSGCVRITANHRAKLLGAPTSFVKDRERRQPPIFASMRRGAYLLGVAGGSGSGKTTLIRALRERVQVLERVITDNEASSHRLEREIDALRDQN